MEPTRWLVVNWILIFGFIIGMVFVVLGFIAAIEKIRFRLNRRRYRDARR